MAKNKVQFQKGYSLVELFHEYGTEDRCRDALFQWKWPNGFRCPECGCARHCQLQSRQLFQCNQCHHQTSLTAHTLFENTKLPLTTWFLAVHLIVQAKTGLSCLALKRQLGVSYNTAWKVKHKIMQVMKERDDSHPLTGFVQVDDAYWGGEQHGGKRGRGSSNKTPFVAAVEVNEQGHPTKMHMQVLKGFRHAESKKWSQQHLQAGSQVVSDGLACFAAVTESGCEHIKVVTGGGPASVEHEEFTWVNTMLGKVKTSLHGTYHAINPKHLPRYLAEFCYRFNRRYQLAELLPRFMSVAVRTPPMPYRLLRLAEVCG